MRFLLTPESYIDFFKKTLRELRTENSSPSAIAVGVSIGVVIAILPFYGVQTLLAIGISFLLRRFKINKIAVILGSQLSIPPIAAFLFAVEFGVGNLVIDKSWVWIKFGRGMMSQISRGYVLILLGSLVLSPIAFIISYYLTKRIIYSLKDSP